jgi:hypothetical protein
LLNTKLHWFYSHPAALISLQQTFPLPKVTIWFKRCCLALVKGNTRKNAIAVKPELIRTIWNAENNGNVIGNIVLMQEDNFEGS